MMYLVEVDAPTQGMIKNIWDRIFFLGGGGEKKENLLFCGGVV